MSERTCGQDECEEGFFAKGLCKKHYYQQYNAANREHRLARAREYYQATKERQLEQAKERYAASPEVVKERVRKWRAEHPGQFRAANQRYRETNLERLREYDAQPERMAKKAERKRERYEECKLEGLLVYGDGTCADCGYEPDDIFELEVHHVNHDGVDHRASVTGMRRGGSFQFYLALKKAGWPTNVPLVTLCGRCHKKRTIAHRRAS